MRKIRIILLFLLMVVLSGFVRINHQLAYQVVWNWLLQVAMPVHCSADMPDDIQKWAVQSAKKVGASAAQVAVYSGEKRHHCEMGWVGRPFFSKHVQSNSQFWYASITKLFTAELIFNEIRQHRLSLDTPVAKILSAQKYQQRQDNVVSHIQIGHLLSHTVGIDHEKQADVMMDQNSWCPKDMGKIYSISLDYVSGSYFSYNNLGYCLLGGVVGHLEHQDFTRYAHRYFSLETKQVDFIHEKITYNEVKQKKGIVWSPTLRFNLAAGGGMRGSALSLAELMKTISQKPKPNIRTRHNYSDVLCQQQLPRGCHGLAMYHFHPENSHHHVVWKDGSIPGVSAVALIHQNNNAVVFLANSRHEGSWKEDNEEIVIQYLRKIK